MCKSIRGANSPVRRRARAPALPGRSNTSCFPSAPAKPRCRGAICARVNASRPHSFLGLPSFPSLPFELLQSCRKNENTGFLGLNPAQGNGSTRPFRKRGHPLNNAAHRAAESAATSHPHRDPQHSPQTARSPLQSKMAQGYGCTPALKLKVTQSNGRGR